MRKVKTLLLLTLIYTVVQSSQAQEKINFKFGKIAVQDFEHKVYTVDSSAAAVVLADVGQTEFVGNDKGWFSLEFKHYKRIHILTKTGYDIANVTIPIYQSGNMEEEVRSIKAVTYNLENGKIVETKLEKSGVFKEKMTKNHSFQKFTFPNIKEGSIVEYEYTLRSDFLFNLQPWEFQGAYPRLWSEYTVSMPEFFVYMPLVQGYIPFHIKENKGRSDNFLVRDSRGTSAADNYRFSAGVMDHRWVMKDVPALKEESFTSTLSNHLSKISFQLAEYRYPLEPKNVMATWGTAFQEMLQDENFGLPISGNNGWLGEYVNPVIDGATGQLEKARKIYYHLASTFTCTNHNGVYLRRPLKTIAKEKNGTVAELNLLLTAMLRYAGLHADPVLLSTRSNGFVYPYYPLVDKFNYVICHTHIDNVSYFLDGSWPLLGFGKLLPDCYNGHARLVTPAAEPLNFDPDKNMERSTSSIRIVLDSAGNMEGVMSEILGAYESYTTRKNWKEKGKDAYVQTIKKVYGDDGDVSDIQLDSLEHKEENLVLKYKFKMKGNGEDIIYLSPMFGEAWKDNPFKATQRLYPVEMPYTIHETFAASIFLPDNYVVEELPKQVVVRFQDAADGLFEYMIMHSGGVISLRTKIQINRAVFSPEEYDFLREFFSYVIKKQAEQIVLKKKS